MLKRILKALGPDLAASADPLRLARRAALLREERLRIRLRTQRPILPALLGRLVGADAARKPGGAVMPDDHRGHDVLRIQGVGRQRIRLLLGLADQARRH